MCGYPVKKEDGTTVWVGMEEPKLAEPLKPKCKLIGENGNVFFLLGTVMRTLRKNGLHDQANECQQKVTSAGSYDEALAIMRTYVDIV